MNLITNDFNITVIQEVVASGPDLITDMACFKRHVSYIGVPCVNFRDASKNVRFCYFCPRETYNLRGVPQVPCVNPIVAKV